MEVELMQVINEGLTEQQNKRYSLQLLNTVKYIHELGIIRGDIKPNNVIVKWEDIKLIDFENIYTLYI